MKAMLVTGEIVELLKDCECSNHSGPHWVHLDDLDKQRATELLNDGDTAGHIELSLDRLERKLQEMTSRGIEQIIRE